MTVNSPMQPKRRCCQPINPEREAELLALIGEGKTIEAIKKLRKATSARLIECKGWVDERGAGMFRQELSDSAFPRFGVRTEAGLIPPDNRGSQPCAVEATCLAFSMVATSGPPPATVGSA